MAPVCALVQLIPRHSPHPDEQSRPWRLQYNVSLSNDNSSFSSPTTVTVFDTTCVNIENGAAVILSGFCYIAGVCYADAAVNPTDACRYCNVSVDTATWQLNMNDSACEMEKEEENDNIFFIGNGAALGTGAAVALAIGIVIYLYKKMQVSKVVAARWPSESKYKTTCSFSQATCVRQTL
ncbi:von Willebrand factor D and EGF domain-containing protein-like [Dreissena polymorpha]|uniref:von Willebrand factor D and EGF domain-containing protein-like n=1 Tax=Dreissena polymorpha TaxID=45954 RepID=UPI002265359D|nr:von Willebrand factor D and EGF domain-containing protein-like [Dreissena polymorpha]